MYGHIFIRPMESKKITWKPKEAQFDKIMADEGKEGWRGLFKSSRESDYNCERRGESWYKS